MDAARWDRVQDLFHEAAGRSASERPRFLEETCGEDHELLAAVTAMLEEDSRASLLDCDVAQVASCVLGDPLSGAMSTSFQPARAIAAARLSLTRSMRMPLGVPMVRSGNLRAAMALQTSSAQRTCMVKLSSTMETQRTPYS